MERGTGDAFMVEVSAQTLLPIIQQYVLPGTTIMSDEWRAYQQVTSLGMSHQTVNHSLHFVDPTSTTQQIESTWAQTKRMMRKEGVMRTSSDLFPTYLPEYLWCKKFSSSDPFITILDHIKEQYPL